MELHIEEDWRQKCERFVRRQIDAKAGMPDSPRSGRSIIPPTRLKYRVNPQRKRRLTSDLYVRKAYTLSGVHGVPYAAFVDSRLGRSVWVLVILVGIAVTLYLISAVVREFYADARRVKMSYASGTPTTRLVVTLCNANSLRKSRVSSTRFEPLLTLVPGADAIDDISTVVDVIPELPESLMTLMKESGIADPVSYVTRMSMWTQLFGGGDLKADDWKHVEQLLRTHGRSDLWPRFLQASREEVMSLGHQPHDILLRCRLRGQPCADR